MSDASNHDTTKSLHDLRDLLKQFAQPVIDNVDGRFRHQVEQRVDDRIDQRVDDAVDAALTSRLAVLERAVADLDRAVRELQTKLDAL